MFRQHIDCWFLYVPEVISVITQIYALIEHPVLLIDLFFPVGAEMDSTVFSKTNVCGCNSCHIRHYFPVVYLTTHNVTNIIFCKMFHWFINNDLKRSVGNKLCSISGILLRQPENVVSICHQCSCCVGRNSNVNTAQINCVFLVTALPNFTCDIPFSVSDMDE